MISLLICKVYSFFFFKLENELSEIETSQNFVATFYLKFVTKPAFNKMLSLVKFLHFITDMLQWKILLLPELRAFL